MHYVMPMTQLVQVSHSDELRHINYVIRMTYPSILCHPDDSTEVGISPGWVMAMFFYVIPFLSRPDEIANFDFSQHTVALQYFRKV